jgi:hypothetical protein
MDGLQKRVVQFARDAALLVEPLVEASAHRACNLPHTHPVKDARGQHHHPDNRCCDLSEAHLTEGHHERSGFRDRNTG